MYLPPLGYPYYRQPPMGSKSVFIIPPGYKRDYSGGYKTWGDLADDLNNLF